MVECVRWDFFLRPGKLHWSYICPVNFDRSRSAAFTGIRRGWHRLVNARRRSCCLLGRCCRAWYTGHDRMNQQRQLIARLAPLESVGTTPRECADNKSICPVVGGISSPPTILDGTVCSACSPWCLLSLFIFCPTASTVRNRVPTHYTNTTVIVHILIYIYIYHYYKTA